MLTVMRWVYESMNTTTFPKLGVTEGIGVKDWF
uniref:Uncharacterized protein n=1 Tax=Anguilla anguilla TaxID=7936 RepID=A0A0E9ULP7_ANGAN